MAVIDYSTLVGKPEYVIQIANRSTAQLYFLCFQPVPADAPSGTYPLAWFAQPLAVQANAYFVWQQSYGLVWAETGPLGLDQIVRQGQFLPADLDSMNTAKLTNIGGAYQFSGQTSGTPGTLMITPDGTIPADTVSIGIGMSNQPTMVVQAMANVPVAFEPPVPTMYTVAFSSTKIQKGQTLNSQSFASTSCELLFPPNQHGAIATLGENNTWTVTYKSSLVVRS